MQVEAVKNHSFSVMVKFPHMYCDLTVASCALQQPSLSDIVATEVGVERWENMNGYVRARVVVGHDEVVPPLDLVCELSK